jgi:hypothetical protein
VNDWELGARDIRSRQIARKRSRIEAFLFDFKKIDPGKLIDAKGEKARFVRLYSKGNNGNDLNHYIEVEVYGK